MGDANSGSDRRTSGSSGISICVCCRAVAIQRLCCALAWM